VLLGLICALLVWGVSLLPPVRGLEDWFLDGWFFARGQRATAARIVIIALDDHSLREIKKPLPWISPELARVMKWSQERGAAAIGLDLMVPDDRSEDKEINAFDGPGEAWGLGQLVVRSHKVVLPVRQGDDGPLLPLRQWRLKEKLQDPNIQDTDLGFVDLNEDGDQIVRRQRLVMPAGNGKLPHFALKMFARSRGETIAWDNGELHIGSERVPLDTDGTMRINFAGPSGRFPIVPFHEALGAAEGRGELSEDLNLNGAIVLIGVTDRSLQDWHSTPYANHYGRYLAGPGEAPGLMAGTELHAHIVATLTDRAFITTPWWLSSLAWLLIFGASLGWAYARLNLEAGFLLAILHHFAWKAVAYAAFAYAQWRIEVVPMLLLGAVTYAATFAFRWRVLRRMFGVVQSEAVARALESDPQRLDPGGEEREVTVLFADVRRFTDFSEKHRPEEVVAMLNAYFGAVVPVIEAEGGTISNFIGDGVMILFGAPASQADHALRAVRAAVVMVQQTHAHLQEWKKLDRANVWGDEGLRIGVGVHTGTVVVGAVGAPMRLVYTAIGDAVNAAARIESENKTFGTEVLVSAATVTKLSPEARTALRVAADPVEATVKGKAEKLLLYPVTVA
jgi:adenylate cyclase